MKKNYALLLILSCCYLALSAQGIHPPGFLADSSDTRPLAEIMVKAYEQHRKLAEVGAPVHIINKSSLNRFGNVNILPALNMAPGVRMEERSPGSYRLNIRGSSLRSPFGVRDVKIYWNEIPLTDPGGNTYLNQLGFYDIQSLEIIKGTAGSLYGAGIGGAVLISGMPAVWEKGVSADYTAGNYANDFKHLATNSFNVDVRVGDADHRNHFSYSHQTNDGYRQQTRMRRDIATWETLIKSSERQTIHAYLLYGDLHYQTPGGLNKAEYDSNARMARPAAGTSPSAIQAQAAIYQKNFTAGFANEYRFNAHWQNTSSVYGAYTDFTNPGIRVYEYRQEPHFGGRTAFQYKTALGFGTLQLNFGAEAQKGFFETRDYANKLGVQGALQTDDKLNNWTWFSFVQADLRMQNGWTITAGGSFNKSALDITRVSVLPPAMVPVRFDSKLAPRIAVLKRITPDISAYASASRGFSTPTVSEIEKSNGVVGPPLQPEDGVDYELGARGSLLHGRLFFDVDAFLFHIHNAIVQRIDSGGVAYSINAGSTDQHGLETFVSYRVIDAPQAFVSDMRIFVSDTWHDFHYNSFIQDTSNFNGHRLPSVPQQLFVTGIDLVQRDGFYLNMTYTYSDKVALNDANTAYAGSYNLLGGRLGYRRMIRKLRFDIYTSVDNAGNVKYSLGNDFNAAAGRYYNVAPGRNYFAGASLNYAL
ncbi:MAG TPA: TonB-dependent receptor [Puia sp.]|uniref:TonB-dependent receptor n=1 Tax=Puia sp. TaxID=2045100 RepID=UPI002C41EA5D|nr:TonB-dependent receptor [Puia sp.]HVU98995.1 TonB-dependent receptor [Puia sp.]